MTTTQGSVLVIGGTGHQGAAVIRHLRERGVPVRALVDKSNAGDVRALQAAGVTPVYASLDDEQSLVRAMRSAAALFFVLDDVHAGPADRLRTGRAIGDAAAQAGIGHVVYSASTGPDHHINACDQSKEVERHLRELRLPLTALHPATVMEEIPWYWLRRFADGLVLATPFAATTRLPLVSVDDMGGLAALAIASPERFIGMTIDVAGDTVSVAELAELLTEHLGERVSWSEVQVEGVFIYPEAARPPHDLAWLRSVYPDLHSASSWLEQSGGLELCRQVTARTAV
jgi:uncharacterized protein YbjT (DUF2867 family)